MGSSRSSYPVGLPGQKWTDADRANWLSQQSVKRSYEQQVLRRLLPLSQQFERWQYGSLSYDESRFPLYALKTKAWVEGRPCALVTGGVHGYETSGVQGAVRFLETAAHAYADKINIVVLPCVSPWGYETINRWNPNTVDPNRSFYANSPSEEAAAVMRCIDALGLVPDLHVDLHETTDSDATEFRPALAARDALDLDLWEDIPDGFYLVGDSENPQPEFQAAIIRAVAKITQIAPADDAGNIIGEPLQQQGVINYAVKALHLCAGLTDAAFCTTTEVYPDSPTVDDENCIQAQVTTICAALDYLLAQGGGD